MKFKAQLSDMNMKPFVISPQCCVAPYQGAFNLSSVRRPDRSNQTFQDVSDSVHFVIIHHISMFYRQEVLEESERKSTFHSMKNIKLL